MGTMNKTLYITRGLPGCGKSTWAKQKISQFPVGEAIRVNRDLVRENLHFSNWSKEAEKITVAIRNSMLRIAMETGVQVVISDDTNLDPKVATEIANIGREYGYEIAYKDFTDVPVHVCIDRDSMREGTARVGSEIILRMHNRYLNYARKTDA